MTPEALMRQAAATAAEYLDAAIREIDAALGMGYAAKHPELVAAFMQTAASDFDTMIRYQIAQEGEAA